LAAPTLQAQGDTVAVTTGSLTVTLPTHAADDILIATTIDWVPNTSGNAGVGGTPTNWAVAEGGSIVPFGEVEGHLRVFWRRATTSGHPDPVFTRGTSPTWDTGTDTCFAGRAYVIRGCKTTGNPWDAIGVVDNSGFEFYLGTANGAIPAVTVSGSDRLVVQFVLVADNTAIGTAPSGWTGGTIDSDNTGTGANFQTYRRTPSANTAAAASNVDSTDQGYTFYGFSFRPAVTDGAAALSGAGSVASTATRVRSGSTALAGAGTLAATSIRVQHSSSAFSGEGTLAAAGVRVQSGQAALAGQGTLAANPVGVFGGSAALAGAGSLSAVPFRIAGGSASLAGVGSLSASSVGVLLGQASLSGAGGLTAAAVRVRLASASLAAAGTLAASANAIFAAAAVLQGQGTLNASAGRILQGSAALVGAGNLTAAAVRVLAGAAVLQGQGNLAAAAVLVRVGQAILTGQGTLTATGLRISAVRWEGSTDERWPGSEDERWPLVVETGGS
jgi:hypothetical protein